MGGHGIMAPHSTKPLTRRANAQQHHFYRALKPERGHGSGWFGQQRCLHHLRPLDTEQQLRWHPCWSQVRLEPQVQAFSPVCGEG